MAAGPEKVFTWDEVEQHNSVSAGVWVVIDDLVYDVTQFVDEHPGGDEVLLDNAGGDATSAFNDVGHSQDAIDLRHGFLIGRIAPSPPPLEEREPLSSNLRAAVGVAAGVAVPVLAVLGLALGAYFIYRRYKQ